MLERRHAIFRDPAAHLRTVARVAPRVSWQHHSAGDAMGAPMAPELNRLKYREIFQ